MLSDYILLIRTVSQLPTDAFFDTVGGVRDGTSIVRTLQISSFFERSLEKIGRISGRFPQNRVLFEY